MFIILMLLDVDLRATAKVALRSLRVLVMGAFGVVIGGIVAGVFTATEAAAVAVLYSAILAFLYREVKVKDLPQILLDTAATTAVVMLLIGTSMAMSWLLSYENIPQNMSAALLALISLGSCCFCFSSAHFVRVFRGLWFVGWIYWGFGSFLGLPI